MFTHLVKLIHVQETMCFGVSRLAQVSVWVDEGFFGKTWAQAVVTVYFLVLDAKAIIPKLGMRTCTLNKLITWQDMYTSRLVIFHSTNTVLLESCTWQQMAAINRRKVVILFIVIKAFLSIIRLDMNYLKNSRKREKRLSEISYLNKSSSWTCLVCNIAVVW